MTKNRHRERNRRKSRTRPTPASPRATKMHHVVSRRWLLFNAAIALNGLVGLVLAVPVVPLSACAVEEGLELRLLGIARGRRRISRRRDAPRVLQESCDAIPGTGRPITSPVMCATRERQSVSASSPSTARTSAARCAGFRNRSSSCVRATAGSTMPTARALPVRPSAGYSPTTGRSSPANCRSTPAKCRHSRTPRSWSKFP